MDSEKRHNEKRWMALCERLGVQRGMKAAYDDLVSRYSEPHRAYHILEHIKHCLCEFEQVRSLLINPDAVELAIWYHDAGDSEEQSAELAMDFVRKASLPDSFGELVKIFILVTKHLEIPDDPDAQFLVDIDLSILGQPESRFDEYEQQVRKEYEWVPYATFVAGRSGILQSFFDRPNIYATQFFRNKYEERARQNITRSLANLR